MFFILHLVCFTLHSNYCFTGTCMVNMLHNRIPVVFYSFSKTYFNMHSNGLASSSHIVFLGKTLDPLQTLTRKKWFLRLKKKNGRTWGIHDDEFFCFCVANTNECDVLIWYWVISRARILGWNTWLLFSDMIHFLYFMPWTFTVLFNMTQIIHINIVHNHARVFFFLCYA